MDKLKLGILGCGPISQYAHLPAARKSKYIDLAAICDQAEDLLQDMASQYKIPQAYVDHHEFLEQSDIEAVVIAVADAFHVPLALDCLKAGKHVLVEKPVSASSDEALELAQALEDDSPKVLVGNMKRHDPGIEFARKFAAERIGPLFSISGWYCDTFLRPQLQETLLLPLQTSQYSKKPAVDPRADKEDYSLLTHGIHLVNTLQYLGGKISRLVGNKVHFSGSYSWHVVIEFESGATGHFELTVKTSADWSEGFLIHGEFGSVSGKTFLPFFRRPSDVQAFDIRTGITETPIGADSDPYKRQLDSFARSILEDEPLACPVDEAIHDLKVLEALKRSLQSGAWEEV